MRHQLSQFIFFASLFLVGCAGHQSVFVPVAASAESGSVVYIYRPAKTANVMLTPDVIIEGVKSFGISSGDYKQLYLTPGKHVIRLAATDGNTPVVEHDLEVAREQVHYLRVDASMKLEFGQTYQPYQRKFALIEVSAEKAVTEIASCVDMDDHVRKKKPADAAASQTEENEATFSVDKTANPFSR